MQLQSGTPSLGTEANSVEETDYTWTQDEDEIEITVYPVVTPSTQRDGGSIYRQKVDTDFVSKSILNGPIQFGRYCFDTVV